MLNKFLERKFCLLLPSHLNYIISFCSCTFMRAENYDSHQKDTSLTIDTTIITITPQSPSFFFFFSCDFAKNILLSPFFHPPPIARRDRRYSLTWGWETFGCLWPPIIIISPMIGGPILWRKQGKIGNQLN